ncbi:MAG: hypothetical protein N2322_00730, partial [Terrimicrobiaceae bacterium]|nr:hypothetical protein [Terrimicrobiaceae bacterium]
DWAAAAELGIEKLDLSGSALALPASLGRGFSRLRELGIASTPTASIEAVRMMPQLERLDLANTEARDLSPLLWCRRLRHLDISGGDRTGLRNLLNLPLESLCLSPFLISDKAGLQALRSHRTLKILRTPADSGALAPAVFWSKLDSGGYDTAGE